MKKKNVYRSFLGLITNRSLFSAIYLVTSLLWSFPITSLFFQLPMQMVFVWGILLIAYDFFTRRIMFSGYKSFWLVLFGISYLITILLHTDRLYEGIKHFFYNGILIYIIYPFSEDKTEKEYKRHLTIINDIVILVAFLASFISLILFALKFSYTFTRGDYTFSMGIVYNRLHGVYTSANVGAVLSILSVGFTGIIYVFDKGHFKQLRWFYITNAVIQFLYYSLTLSRGGHIMLIMGLLSLSTVFIYPHFLKRMKQWTSIAMTVLFLIITLTFMETATVGARHIMLLLPDAITAVAPSGDTESEKEIKLERVDSSKELTNGRLTIWQAGIALLKQSPLFGIGDAKVYSGGRLIADIEESRLSKLNVRELQRANGYMHNGIIQILVYSGISGLCLFIIFTVYVAKKYIFSLLRLYGTQSYPPIAAVLILLSMLLSQLITEAHLLFNRQDAYAVIFWLYLGFGMFMIKDKHGVDESSVLFICDTPYQVLQSVQIARVTNSASCDIYVYDQFTNAVKISENLRNTGIFKQVILFQKYKSYSGLIQKLTTIYRICFPEHTIKKHSKAKLHLHPYQTIYLSYFTPFSDSVKLLNRNAEVIQYEDGIGSYRTKDLEAFSRTKLFDYINTFFLNNRLSYNTNILYLNRPEKYKYANHKQLRKIPQGDTDALRDIFDYQSNDLYDCRHYIYLTQPLSETTAGEVSQEIEASILSLIKDDSLIRVHPRQDKKQYSEYYTDTVDNLWELECAYHITEKHVLIGAFSTAQFSPKMLFDKEPEVIFTYKLYGNTFENADETVEILRSMYTDPQKVIVAHNLQDLCKLITQTE